MTNRIKVLIVGDGVRILNTLSQRLGLRDFDVTPASSGQQALELAQGQEFDLVLLDLRMPQLSGEEVLKVLKEKYPLTEVILLTEHDSIESAVDSSRAGSYMHLQNTAETAELLRVLKEAYQKRVQRKLAISAEKLLEITTISISESPLSIIRKLRELDASRCGVKPRG